MEHRRQTKSSFVDLIMQSVFPLLLCVFVSILYTVSCEENVDTNTLSETNMEIERYAREVERSKINGKSSEKNKNKNPKNNKRNQATQIERKRETINNPKKKIGRLIKSQRKRK